MQQDTPEREGTAALFYDGHCPLCMREMARLGKLKSDKLRLVDIHTHTPADDFPDTDTLLRDLHLRLPGGQWLSGVEANVEAWNYTRYGRWLRWLRWPVIRALADLAYVHWARWRYQRLYRLPCANRKDA